MVVAAGQLNVGAVVSRTVKLDAHVLVLPAASTMYSVTAVVPKPTVLPMAGLCVTARALADGYEKAANKPWLQGIPFTYALFEVAAKAFQLVSDPHDREAVAAAIGKVKLDTIAGTVDFTTGKPNANTCVFPEYAGQYQKGGKFRYQGRVRLRGSG